MIPGCPRCWFPIHRPGFYFPRADRGTVEAGQEIIKVASGPEGMTVTETDALLYLPGHPRQQVAARVAYPALSAGWKSSFQDILDQSGEASGNAGLAKASPPPAWPGFRPLAVTGIDRESETVISVHLAIPRRSVPAALPGQILDLRLHPDPAGRPLLRSYSLVGGPGRPRLPHHVKAEETRRRPASFLHTGCERVTAGASAPYPGPSPVAAGHLRTVPTKQPLIHCPQAIMGVDAGCARAGT